MHPAGEPRSPTLHQGARRNDEPARTLPSYAGSTLPRTDYAGAVRRQSVVDDDLPTDLVGVIFPPSSESDVRVQGLPGISCPDT